MLTNPVLLRAAALYLPLAGATAVGFVRPAHTRRLASVLVALCWTLPSLVLLQAVNQHQHWWSFQTTGPTLRGEPVELLLGWVILWGILSPIAFPQLSPIATAALFLLFDLFLMPRLAPVLQLSPHWILGEIAAIAFILLPGLVFARATQNRTHLAFRATMQVVTSALLFLFLLPELTFALRPGAGWSPLFALPSIARQLMVQLLCVLALPGVSAVQEFATRGSGTPFPYDPPERLVTSGVFRYCANPMQLSCTAVMVLSAVLLRSPWLALAAMITIVYSAGIAHWDESVDLRERYGDAYEHFRAHVPNWRLRWRPYTPGEPARLYLARECVPCSELRRWIERHHPTGLLLLDAETLPAGSIQRLRYAPADGTLSAHGIVALARALEHLHLGWAFAGFFFRLPGVTQLTQIFADVCGFGPRTLTTEACELPRLHR